MIQTNGFYITTNQYLVVDTPVFDEITESIQLMQFFLNENQLNGTVIIAEFGELDPHLSEFNVEDLRQKLQAQATAGLNEKNNELWYKTGSTEEFPKWFNTLNSKILIKKKNPDKFPRVYVGKMEKDATGKIIIYPENTKGNITQISVEETKDEKLSAVYHYEDKDMISIFTFVSFN